MSSEFLSASEPPTISELQNLAPDPDSYDSGPLGSRGVTFEEIFKAFAKFGDPKSDGKTIGLSNSDKWMKQARVIDNRKITTNDTCIYFKKFKLPKLTLDTYVLYLEELAKSKGMQVEDLIKKMTICGKPGHQPPPGVVKAAMVVNRPPPVIDYAPPTVDKIPGYRNPTTASKAATTASKGQTRAPKTFAAASKANKAAIAAIDEPSTSDEPKHSPNYTKRRLDSMAEYSNKDTFS